MNNPYRDIRDKIEAAPVWFDEHAVPRYCPFAPLELADIYADECCLAEIACQDCGKLFLVAFSTSLLKRIWCGIPEQLGATLAEEIRAGCLHYGDPPNAECCPAGATMNSETLRVVEYWKREDFDWARDAALELTVDGETAAKFGMGNGPLTTGDSGQ